MDCIEFGELLKRFSSFQQELMDELVGNGSYSQATVGTGYYRTQISAYHQQKMGLSNATYIALSDFLKNRREAEAAMIPKKARK